jgi:hypothetical protein
MPCLGHISLAAAVLVVIACGGDPRPTPTGATPVSPQPPDSNQQGCARTSVGLTPLTELGSDTYQQHPGGLYPTVSNTAPPQHLASGIELARAIGPMDVQGRPSASGRYAFISVGMSNTTQEFRAFQQQADGDGSRDTHLVIVDGAQGGQTAADWANPGCQCWSVLDQRLGAAGVSAQQVAAAWIKLADRQPSEGFPAHAQRLQRETVTVVQRLKTKFPNLNLAYLSSRIYAGYATTTLNPEPYAYESAFAVRWTLEDQLQGRLPFGGAGTPAPWLAWGPYLWANGLTPRGDGLTWACSDFAADGTHPSDSGRQKVAGRLLQFVRTDPTAREWYLANP